MAALMAITRDILSKVDPEANTAECVRCLLGFGVGMGSGVVLVLSLYLSTGSAWHELS